LAAEDYSGNYKEYNEVLEQIGTGLAIIFAFECALKIVANGFANGSNTYLRSGWNVMDFFIVLSSVVG
jgi:hypothetical protein